MSEREPITAELRRVMNHTTMAGIPLVEIGEYEFVRRCDAIDAVHAGLERENAELRQRVAVLDESADSMHGGWVRLPVDGEAPCKQLGEWIEKRGLITGPLDHDGELWHKGDMSASPWGVIEGIVFENGKWFIRGHDTSAPWVPADSISRYHEPTVEDVLREFANEVYADADNEIRDRDFLCAKYAKRLTLVGDAS